jgi:hypothetical protein
MGDWYDEPVPEGVMYCSSENAAALPASQNCWICENSFPWEKGWSSSHISKAEYQRPTSHLRDENNSPSSKSKSKRHQLVAHLTGERDRMAQRHANFSEMNHFYCTGAFEVRAQSQPVGKLTVFQLVGPIQVRSWVQPIFGAKLGIRTSSTWWALVYDQSTALGLRGSAEPSMIEYCLSLPPCIWFRKVDAVRKLLLW